MTARWAGLAAPRDLAALACVAVAGCLLSIGTSGWLAAGVIGVATCVFALAPRVAAPAMFATVPFVFHPAAVGGSRFSLLELTLVTGGVAVAARLAIDAARLRQFAEPSALLFPLEVTLVACALIAVGALSLLTVADPAHRVESVRQFRVVVLEPCAAILLVRVAVRRGGGPLSVATLLATGCAVAIWALLDSLTGRGLVLADGVARARGPYPHPNNLALYLDRLALFAAGFAVALPRFRRFTGFVAVLLFAGVAVTLSRGSILAVMAGSIWIVWMCRPAHGWRLLSGGFAAAMIAFGALASGRLFDRGSTSTTSSRLAIWRSSWHMARDHAWTGVGLDQFLYQYGRRYVTPSAWPERYTSHPHNVVFDFWLSLGIGGLALLVAIGSVAARQVWRGAHASAPFTRAVAVGCGAALIGGLTHGLVDNSFFLPDLAVLTWGFIALAGAEATET